jgi:hypothetical protein
MDGQYYISEEAFEQATHAVMLRHRFTHDEALREAASHAKTLSTTLMIIDGTDQ